MEADLSFLELWAEILRRRWQIVAWGGTFAFLLVLWASIWPSTYTASASFAPQGDDQGGGASRVAGLAAQFGIALGGSTSGQSPEFYVDLLTSDALLRPLVLMRFRPGKASDKNLATLVEIINPSGSPAEQVFRAIDKVRRRYLVASADDQTGMVNLTVKSLDPGLSKEIADSLVALVNEFNVKQRQTQARAQRVFAEARAADGTDSLREAEDRMQEFMSRNRDFRSSPPLTFEYQRLQRVLDMRQQVLASLLIGLEQSRMDEVRNTPVITVVESPVVPALRDPRGRVIKGLLGLILGGAIGMGMAVWKRLMTIQRETRPTQFAEVQAVVGEMREERRSAWRKISRLLRRSRGRP